MSIDEQMLERVKGFDPGALSAFHNQFFAPVYRYIRFKVTDPDLSQDLTCEVFVRVLQALKQGRAWNTTPGAWVFGIARNLVADHYRRRGQRSETALDESLPLLEEDSPIEQVMMVEQREEMARAITSLTDEQRDVVLLRFMDGLSIDEVARVINKTPGAVKGLQHRALRVLSDEMQSLSGEGASLGGAE